jgi:hypothetical protein
MTEVEAAWLAGLFDGEGSIVCSRGSDIRRSIRITVTNTRFELLEHLREVVGTGAIIVQPRREAHHSPTWYWLCHSDNARELLRQMQPWLIVKRERAAEALSKEE